MQMMGKLTVNSVVIAYDNLTKISNPVLTT